jgi:hypothetical protein
VRYQNKSSSKGLSQIIIIVGVIIVLGAVAVVGLNIPRSKTVNVNSREKVEEILAKECPSKEEITAAETFVKEANLEDLLDDIEEKKSNPSCASSPAMLGNGYGTPTDNANDPNCYKVIAYTVKGYGPRCFKSQEDVNRFHRVYLFDSDPRYGEGRPLNHPLSESELAEIIEFLEQSGESAPTAAGDPRTEAYNKWLECKKGLSVINDDSSHCDALLEGSTP